MCRCCRCSPPRNHRWCCCCCCCCLWLDRSTTKEQQQTAVVFLYFFFHPRTLFFFITPPLKQSTCTRRGKNILKFTISMTYLYVDNNMYYVGRISSLCIILLSLRVGCVLSKTVFGSTPQDRYSIFLHTICNIIVLIIRVHVLHFFFFVFKSCDLCWYGVAKMPVLIACASRLCAHIIARIITVTMNYFLWQFDGFVRTWSHMNGFIKTPTIKTKSIRLKPWNPPFHQ